MERLGQRCPGGLVSGIFCQVVEIRDLFRSHKVPRRGDSESDPPCLGHVPGPNPPPAPMTSTRLSSSWYSGRVSGVWVPDVAQIGLSVRSVCRSAQVHRECLDWFAVQNRLFCERKRCPGARAERPSIQIVRDRESCGIEKCGQHIDIFDHGVGLNLCLHLARPANHHATLKALVITSPLGNGNELPCSLTTMTSVLSSRPFRLIKSRHWPTWSSKKVISAR